MLNPLCIYSAFHVISFLNNNPQVIPKVHQAALSPLIKLLAGLVQAPALSFAAHLECLLLPYLFLTRLFQAPIAICVFYPQFLRWQYGVSPKTRNVFRIYAAQVQRAISSPKCPPQVRLSVIRAMAMVSKMAPPAYSASIPVVVTSPASSTSSASASAASGRPRARPVL